MNGKLSAMTCSRTGPAVVLALWSVAGLPACSDAPSAAAQTPIAATPGQDTVVAEVGGRTITLRELDAKWEEFDAAERARVTQLLYQNRRNMLDQVIGDVLIEQAAKAAGMAKDAYEKRESATRMLPVTDAEVQAFFDQNKDRANGRTIDQLRGPITDFLKGQRTLQAKAQLVDDLKLKSGDLKVLLEAPRYTVALASHDPIRGDSTAPITLVEFSDYQ